MRLGWIKHSLYTAPRLLQFQMIKSEALFEKNVALNEFMTNHNVREWIPLYHGTEYHVKMDK